MKKILLTITLMSLVNASNIDINNTCNGLKVLKTELRTHKSYNEKEVYGFQYSLKNTTNKKLENIRLTLYLKDKNGNRIGEEKYHPKDLKPHYEKPFENNRYYSIDPAPSDFFGVADLEVTCGNTSNNNKSKSEGKFTDIRIPTKLFEAIKEQSKIKSEFGARIEILKILTNHVKKNSN